MKFEFRMEKVFLALLFFFFQNLLWAGSFEGLETIKFSGVDYVRLDEWAESNEMDFRFEDKNATVTNHFAKLEFTANLQKIILNKVTLWMVYVIVQRGTNFFISGVDLQKTLHPVLYPPKEEEEIKNVCIDAGHGGKDPGNLKNSMQEKKFTLQLAKELQNALKKQGFRVQMTRTSDDFVNLYERAAMANRNEVDIFISLHFNSWSIRGRTLGCKASKHFALPRQILLPGIKMTLRTCYLPTKSRKRFPGTCPGSIAASNESDILF
jgi:hypothetical protein